MSEYFEKIRLSVMWQSLLSKFGILMHVTGENQGIIKCIYHEEKTASLVLYRNGKFHCCGCGGFQGDIFDFVVKKLGSYGRAYRFFKKHFDIDLPLRTK